MRALLVRVAATAGFPCRRGLPRPGTRYELPADADVDVAAFVEATATDASAGAVEKAPENARVRGSTALPKERHLTQLLGRETDRRLR